VFEYLRGSPLTAGVFPPARRPGAEDPFPAVMLVFPPYDPSPFSFNAAGPRSVRDPDELNDRGRPPLFSRKRFCLGCLAVSVVPPKIGCLKTRLYVRLHRRDGSSFFPYAASPTCHTRLLTPFQSMDACFFLPANIGI